jgi:hypothetical protein
MSKGGGIVAKDKNYYEKKPPKSQKSAWNETKEIYELLALNLFT